MLRFIGNTSKLHRNTLLPCYQLSPGTNYRHQYKRLIFPKCPHIWKTVVYYLFYSIWKQFYLTCLTWDVHFVKLCLLEFCLAIFGSKAVNALDRVSVLSPIAIDILMDTMARDRAHMYLLFCVNLEWHISTHIITRIKCYLHSLRCIYMPFTNI